MQLAAQQPKAEAFEAIVRRCVRNLGFRVFLGFSEALETFVRRCASGQCVCVCVCVCVGVGACGSGCGDAMGSDVCGALCLPERCLVRLVRSDRG
jgi:hypothetical protein